MNNLLIAIAVFLITVLGALFAVPHFIDWNSYRSVFEEEAKNIIGRDVEVDGDVKLYLLPTPYFRVEKVRIADTSTGLAEHFFKADSISIKLSIAPLLQGIVEVNEIELQKPVLRLALDAQGTWNWQSFAQALGSTGYVPTNVTLASLKVVDGTLALHGADGVERAQLAGLNGELSAPALQGPYRFRGTFTAGRSKREIRLATAAPEGGKVPFRATLRHLDSGASYVLEAEAIDLMGKAKVEGELTARLPIAAASGAGTRLAADGSDPSLEVKSKVAADVAGAAFGDLTLTFELGDRPQVVTGEAKAVWGAPVAIDLRLRSRWLDLDRLAGEAEGAGPADSLTKIAAWLRDRLPGEGTTAMRIEVDQANLAGEAISQLKLGLARSGDRLKLTELRADLPGGSRGEIKGDIGIAADALAFKGSLGLRGTSTARFVAWATGNSLKVADADGPFDLRAALVLDAGRAEVSDLAGTLAGTLLKGSGRYRWSGRPELAVMLEGPKLDVRSWLPADSSLFELLGILAGAASARQDGTRAATGSAVLRALQSDLDLRVRAGKLVTAARTWRDFIGAVTMKGGSLKELKLQMTGDDGATLQLDGKVDNLGTAPKGTLRGLVAAQTAESLGPLAALLGLPPAFRPGESRQQALLPLRLAGALTFGGRGGTSADWTVDGEAGGALVKIAARLDGNPSGWRSGRADFTAQVDAADSGKLARALFPGAAPSVRAAEKPGRVLIRAGGIPAEGLASLVAVDAADVAVNFRGQVRLSEAGTKAEGDLEVRAGDGTTLANLVGLAPTLRLDGVPVSARLALALDGDSIGMDKLSLQLGDSRLSGKVVVSAPAAGERRHIKADLRTDEVSVTTLLTPLIDQRFGAADAAEAVLLGQRSPWPDVPFSGAAFDAFEGELKLNARRLVLAEGMALDGAKVHVVLSPGKVEAKEIAGSALGGTVKAAVTLVKAPAGADVRATLGFGIALEDIDGARRSKASGPVTGTLKLTGRGLSPRAVVAALQGDGSIAFDDAKLPGLAPAAVAAAADAALKAEPGKIGAVLRQSLTANLATDALPVGRATFAVEIADGLARTKSMLIETPEGRATGSARVDLNALRLDSQWRLEAKVPAVGSDSARRPLPPVVVAYHAPLASLKSAEQQIDTAALEQELSARKIEQDLEELERLRRLDESKRNEGKAPSGPLAPPGAPLPPSGNELAPGAPG